MLDARIGTDTEPEIDTVTSITQQLDPDELAAGWEAIDALRPQTHATLWIGAKTDLGSVRENNEDKYDILEPREPAILATKGRMYGVADGMGGHSAGQIASELALKRLMRYYFSDPQADIKASLRGAVEQTNRTVYEDAQLLPERQGMGTTLTAAVVHEERLSVIHVGDSRAYLVRGGVIQQITTDHSWVAEQVRLGAMSLDEALGSPFRNIILRSLGTGPVVEPDYFTLELCEGDTVVICSDGLTGHVDDAEIAGVADASSVRRTGPSIAALRLVNLANERGGRDNITVLLLHVAAIGAYTGE